MTLSEPASAPVQARAHTESYVMPASIETTWRAFTDPAERQVWFGFPLDQLAGALDVDPPRLLRVAVDHPGLPGPTETTVTFEAVDGGTSICHTLGGYGDGPVWEGASAVEREGRRRDDG